MATQEITLSNKEIRYIIDRKLEEFTPEVRRVMELLVSGLKAGEIVAHLHPEPYQNIINRLYRGRKKMRIRSPNGKEQKSQSGLTPVSFADWRRDMPSCKSPHFPRGFGCEGVTEAN